MALNNAQIMTYESLGKVLDYIDERDSMQAVPWNGDKADIKKIVNHSEEVGMRVNGMQIEIDGVTYTLSGMAIAVGEEGGTDNYPIFGGYVMGTYTDATGTEVSEPLYVVIKYRPADDKYAVYSTTKIAGEEAGFVTLDETAVYDDAKEALEAGKKVAFSAVNFVVREYEPAHEDVPAMDGFAISGMLDLLQHEVNTDIPAKSNVQFTGIVAGVRITESHDEIRYVPTGKYYKAKIFVRDESVEVEVNEDTDEIPFEVVEHKVFRADKDGDNWNIMIPDWTSMDSPTIEDLFNSLDAQSMGNVVTLISDADSFIYAGRHNENSPEKDVIEHLLTNGKSDFIVRRTQLNVEPYDVTYGIEVKEIGGSVEKHVIKTEVDADGKITLIEPNNMTDLWDMVAEYGSDLVAEVKGSEFFDVPTPIVVTCNYVSSWSSMLGAPKKGVYFFAPNPLDEKYYGYYLFANELQGYPELVLKGSVTSIAINKNTDVEEVNDRCGSLDVAMFDLRGMEAELDGETVNLEGAIPSNSTDPNGNWQFYGFAKTDDGVPCEVSVKYDPDAEKYVATASRLAGAVVYELPLTYVQGGDYGTPMALKTTIPNPVYASWNDDEEIVSTLNHILDDVYAGKNVNVILHVIRGGSADGTTGGMAYTHAILVDNGFGGDHVALIGGNTSIALDKEGTIFEPYGYIHIERSSYDTTAMYFRSTLSGNSEKFFGLSLAKNSDGTYDVEELPDEGELKDIINEVCYKGSKVTVNVQTFEGALLSHVDCVALEINSYYPASSYKKAVRLFSQHGTVEFPKAEGGTVTEEFGILDILQHNDGSYIATYSPYVPSGGAEGGASEGWVDANFVKKANVKIAVVTGDTQNPVSSKAVEDYAVKKDDEDYKNVQADWNQTNTAKWDFIKNKPEVYTQDDIDEFLEDKVDKDGDKGLSTNDYTTAEKTKLAGIEEGAQKNVQSDWNATSGDSFIKNKPVVYTKAEADGKFVVQVTGKGLSTNDYDNDAKAEVAKIADKVDKVEGKGLSSNDYTDAEKTKLGDLYTKVVLDSKLDNKVDKIPNKGLSEVDVTTAMKTQWDKAEENVQSDWNITDASDDAYIKNKPSVYTKTEVDTKVTDINNKFGDYYKKTETYSQDEVDNTFVKKTDVKSTLVAGDAQNPVSSSAIEKYAFGKDAGAVPTDTTTYGKKQIDDMIAALNGVTMQVVATVPAPADATAGTIYICDGTMYLCYENTGNKVISPIGGTSPDLTQYWKKTDGDLMSSTEHTKLTDDYTKAQVDTELAKKVDKVTGKDLSTNDFTDALKTKLDDLYTKAQLDDELDDKVDNETLDDYYLKTETYSQDEVDTELAKKVDKTEDDYLTKAELITDGIKITPNKGSAIEYKLEDYVEKVELDGNLLKITPHGSTAVTQKPFIMDVSIVSGEKITFTKSDGTGYIFNINFATVAEVEALIDESLA